MLEGIDCTLSYFCAGFFGCNFPFFRFLFLFSILVCHFVSATGFLQFFGGESFICCAVNLEGV